MRLTTLGTGTATPSHRVNSGHLVDAGAVHLLLDCGSGVVHRMGTLGVDWYGITHVALTHFHPDHTSDIATLVFAWCYGALPPRSAAAELIGPAGTDALLTKMAEVFGATVRTPPFPFTVREITPGETLDLGDDVTLEARKVPHTAESIAYSVRRSGRRIVYTGDTAVDESLGEWAHGCDVLLTECSLPESMATPTHLTPERCATLAEAARPELLALTHFYPPVEQLDVRTIIAERFAGPVALTVDGWTTELEEG